MSDEAPRPKRRMKQPTKAELRRQLEMAELQREAAFSNMERATRGFRIAVECVNSLRAARKHDHDAARRVPRWVRRIFRA